VTAREQLAVQGASPVEAAAIMAAIERFRLDTAPPPAAAAGVPRWLRAGRLEAAGACSDERSPWGDSHPWGK
jgi:hypothetical protein